MNLIFDTKNKLLSECAFYNEQYEFAMHSTMEKLRNRYKIHHILLNMYKRQGDRADASLYPVHIVFIPDRGQHTLQVETFLQMFNLSRWQGTGWQPNERFAYQGWVNGYGLKVITVEGLVSGIYFLQKAK